MYFTEHLQGVKSLFNTVQHDFLESFVPTMLQKGYKYYVAYTNTRTNNDYYSNSTPDLYVVFSTSKIVASSAYSYNIPTGSVRLAVRSGNYSTSSSAVNTDRLVKHDFSGTLNINEYEHVYTNAKFGETAVVQPDLTKEGSVNHAYDIGSFFLLGVLLVFTAIMQMWQVGTHKHVLTKEE